MTDGPKDKSTTAILLVAAGLLILAGIVIGLAATGVAK